VPSRKLAPLSLLPACGCCVAVCFYPSHAFPLEEVLALCPDLSRLPRAAVREAFPPYPRGPLAPVRVVLSQTLLAYYSPMRQSRRHAATSRHRAYTQRLRCAGAPRRPARPSLLSLPCFPCMPSTLPRWLTVSSRCTYTVIPDFLELLASRLPTSPVSASNIQRDSPFRGCIVHFMLRPACLPSPPGWLQRDEVICSSPRLLRYIVTPAFNAVRHRATLGIRLDGRTGNLPSSGLSPDKSRQLVRLHNNPG
jgi:hypothetical protein